MDKIRISFGSIFLLLILAIPAFGGRDCIICNNQPCEVKFKPCDHVIACKTCAERNKSYGNKCPFCRKPITEIRDLKESEKKSSDHYLVSHTHQVVSPAHYISREVTCSVSRSLNSRTESEAIEDQYLIFPKRSGEFQAYREQYEKIANQEFSELSALQKADKRYENLRQYLGEIATALAKDLPIVLPPTQDEKRGFWKINDRSLTLSDTEPFQYLITGRGFSGQATPDIALPPTLVGLSRIHLLTFMLPAPNRALVMIDLASISGTSLAKVNDQRLRSWETPLMHGVFIIKPGNRAEFELHAGAGAKFILDAQWVDE